MRVVCSIALPLFATVQWLHPTRSSRRSLWRGWMRTRRRRCCAMAMPGRGDCSARRCPTPWWCWIGGTLAVRFEHALQAARGLGAGTAEKHLADEAVRSLERAKWRLWHGRWPGCRRKLKTLCRWTQRQNLREVAGIERLQRHVSDLLGYLARNQDALPRNEAALAH